MELKENSENDLSWFAVKVFYNRAKAACEYFGARGIRIYTQKFVPSLIFINSTAESVLKLKEEFRGQLFIYMNSERTKPYAIPEKEMTSFILVTSVDYSDMMFLGEDREEYHKGDKVRVKDGPFKGAEGYIKRIKKDRKLIVSINGVAAVALAHILPQLLEKVEDTERDYNTEQ